METAPFLQNKKMRAIGLLLAAVFVLAIQDVIIKSLSGDYALLQVVVIRSCFSLGIVLLLVRLDGGWGSLRSENRALQFWRGMWMFTAYLFFFMGLAALPFSLVTLIFFSNPLFMTALSVIVLGEVVGWRRWTALLVGFVGVLVVIGPTRVEFDFATIFILISAVCYALSMIVNRQIKDTGTSIAAYTTIVYLTFALLLSPLFAQLDLDSTHPSLAFLTRTWATPTAWDVFLIFLTSLCWGFGMVLLSIAYRDAAVAVLAPFEYFSIFFGVLLGYLVWGETITWSMGIGAALIVGSGLFILYRENDLTQEESG